MKIQWLEFSFSANTMVKAFQYVQDYIKNKITKRNAFPNSHVGSDLLSKGAYRKPMSEQNVTLGRRQRRECCVAAAS